ncbi:MAG: response regulator transcription factor [Cyanobacteria bacterium NC_groundwater_1444_Ag_S-0.65um_54_12]|nr:response regulator transcription factor [Cyanobacteria bacterium NC_groundwater_1444_Ag_S-0.65um_54_12]
MAKILVADDDPNIRLLLQKQLEYEGYTVLTVASGRAAIDTARRERPDLLILDLMMPDIDGLEVCRTVRPELVMPIIMLTAKGTDTDKVVGLAIGADEYITKPFSLIELTARVKANLRRVDRLKRSLVESHNRLQIDGLVIDTDQHVVTIGDETLELPFKEYSLLYLLVSNIGKAISRDSILYRVWGDDFFGDDRVVDVHICRLREKLEHFPGCPIVIKTVRGVGYRCMKAAETTQFKPAAASSVPC